MIVFQVEVWLNKLLDAMQSTIRHEMTEAVVSYEEKPRDQWLFDPPAQVRSDMYIIIMKKIPIIFGDVIKEFAPLKLSL